MPLKSIGHLFCSTKGSNWIPAHVLPERVTEDYTAELLYSVKVGTNQDCRETLTKGSKLGLLLNRRLNSYFIVNSIIQKTTET
mgnify:CR=1 FL=1